MSFPFRVFEVSGSEAVVKLAELGEEGDGFPVILGNAENLNHIIESYEESTESPETLIEMARAIDPANWFVERQASDPEYYEIDEDTWPEEEVGAGGDLTSHRNVLTGEYFPKVNIAIIPAPEAWMIPCYLGIGNWNECPHPAEHAAIFKYWGEKYGATVVCIADDVIEMKVTRPPTTREAALELAKEQYLYCADIVNQGTETIEALAATLLDAQVWFFWWD